MRAVVLLLLPSLALAQVYRRPDERGRRGGAVALRVLPAGGGQSHVIDLCDAFASELVGNYFCLRGDGTQRSAAGMTLSAQGSPSIITRPVCPNGPNCASVSATSITGSSTKYLTPAAASPAGDFSVCAVVMKHDGSSGEAFVSHDDESANRAFTLQGSLNNLNFHVWNQGGTTSSVGAAGALTIRAWHLVCATYDFVSDGASVARVYVDGVEKTSSSTFVGPARTAATVKFSACGEDAAALAGKFFCRQAMLTEKVLSATTIQAMANASLGTLSAAAGETVTFSRTSAASCEAEDGTLTILPSGRPCVTRGGLNVFPAANNLILYSEEFNNAAWGKIGFGGAAAPTVTADQAISPDGTMTADRVQFSAASGSQYSLLQQNPGIGTYSASFWVKGNGQSGTLTINMASPVQCGTCEFTDGVWTRCKLENKTTTSAGAVYLGTNALDCGGSYSSADVFVWGGQYESGAVATSYIRTEGSAVARNAEQAAITQSIPFARTMSLAADVIVPSNGTTRHVVHARNTAADEWYLVAASSGGDKAKVCHWDGVFERCTVSTATLPTNTRARISGSFDGTNLRVCVNDACNSTAPAIPANATPSLTTVRVGHYDNTYQATGTVGSVCVSATPEACQ